MMSQHFPKQVPLMNTMLRNHDQQMWTYVEKIIMGVRLSDVHINIAQKLLKDQFCSLNGLESMLLQAKEVSRTEEMVKNKFQNISLL